MTKFPIGATVYHAARATGCTEPQKNGFVGEKSIRPKYADLRVKEN